MIQVVTVPETPPFAAVPSPLPLVVAAASGDREHTGERAGGQPPHPLHRNLLRFPIALGWDD